MCGIIGIVGRQPVTDRLLNGLQRLEYRGYDSAGLCAMNASHFERRRACGKIKALRACLAAQPLDGTAGIGHTRWATHGVPSESNAHPQGNHRIFVVHNGIIENFHPFREALKEQGAVFDSETDTEVIVHLVDQILESAPSKEDLPGLLRSVFCRLEGSFACAILLKDFPDTLVAYRQGNSPLAVALGDHETFCGSDAIALAGLSSHIMYLEDKDFALLSPEEIQIFDAKGAPVMRDSLPNPIDATGLEKGNHPHFMHKEIFEQPQMLAALLEHASQTFPGILERHGLLESAQKLSSLTITACGTAYYAGLVARPWFEAWTRTRTIGELASELRYQNTPLPQDGWVVFVSQSGETVDTLGAFETAQALAQHTLALVNVPGSSLARRADVVIETHAGPEIGVASSKAFTAQLFALLNLALDLGRVRGTLSNAHFETLIREAQALPAVLTKVLALEPVIKTLAASHLADAKSALFLGRGAFAALASEGALKLKELSYIHAEGYGAGEMKHGPIALLDASLPVVVLAPFGDTFDKMIGTIQEVAARKAPLLILTDAKGRDRMPQLQASFLVLPDTSTVTAPFVYGVALQLLAYQTACLLGRDVDQPRNLAKSVTVE